MRLENYLGEYAPIVAVAAFALLVATTLAAVARSAGLYAAFCAMIAGGVCVAISMQRISILLTMHAFSVLAILGGALYLSLYFALRAKEKRDTRRRQRQEIERKVEYALPEKENTFVRERLQTALQPIEEKGDGQPPHFLHAQKLLWKVRCAPLSVAERLEIEELSQQLKTYLEKEMLSAEEVRKVNDIFSRLLKLSAKYAV